MNHDLPPTLALTVGDPAGIGPDIVANIAGRNIPAKIICIADPKVIDARAKALGLEVQIIQCDELSAAPARAHQPGTLVVLPVNTGVPVIPGTLDVNNADYVMKCLDIAITAAKSGTIDAIVTGPVHKGVINDAGFAFTGHTEHLAKDLTPKHKPVMMLVSGSLRVALATTHIALRDVPRTLTTAGLTNVIEVVDVALKSQFNIQRPRIGVCGLNPHAGENGHFGHEDQEIITPAIASAKQRGIAILGPMPADTAFAPKTRACIDAYITMYHDQGLPVIKALGFGEIVNMTLGLPILRTSVDHGTAIELAGTGTANSESLYAALIAAINLVRTRDQ